MHYSALKLLQFTVRSPVVLGWWAIRGSLQELWPLRLRRHVDRGLPKEVIGQVNTMEFDGFRSVCVGEN